MLNLYFFIFSLLIKLIKHIYLSLHLFINLNIKLTLVLNVYQVILHQEGHMDDALTVSRSQTEESQAARMIYSTMGLFRQFNKYVETSVQASCAREL